MRTINIPPKVSVSKCVAGSHRREPIDSKLCYSDLYGFLYVYFTFPRDVIWFYVESLKVPTPAFSKAVDLER